jgi:hypothetical protein
MDGPRDKRRQDEQNNHQSFSIKLVALLALAIIALIGMVVSHPAAIQWVSDAVQAEFVGPYDVGTDLVPTVAPPVQVAQPTNGSRTVSAY